VFRLSRLKNYLKPKPNSKPVYSDADVQTVMQLGYSKPAAVYALEAANGDINRACNMLLECGLV